MCRSLPLSFLGILTARVPRTAWFTVQNSAVKLSELFWLSDAQMAPLEPYFVNSHGKTRVDDRCERNYLHQS